MAIKLKLDCEFYKGNKPCKFYKKYNVLCPCKFYKAMGKRILVIKVGAKGDVLRTTSILTAIKRAYHGSFITWVTDENAVELLKNNPLIDVVLPYNLETVNRLMTEEFDVAYSLDKEHKASALAAIAKAGIKKGSGLSKYGTCCPFNKEAGYWFELGLNDELKFKINKKTYQEMIAEAVGLPYDRKKDRIILRLTEEEKKQADGLLKGIKKKIIGVNAGCNPNFLPNRRWTIDGFAKLIDSIDAKFILFGAEHERERNKEIVNKVKNKGRVIDMTNKTSLRLLAALINRCDVVVSAVSLAVNMAFALNKYTVVLFCQTEPAEVDVYGRGAKIVTKAKCAPCYDSKCRKTTCIDMIDFNDVLDAAKKGLKSG